MVCFWCVFLCKINFILFISIIRILVQKLRCTDVGGNEQSQYRYSPEAKGHVINLFATRWGGFDVML